jgi:IS30 family transposase
VTLHIMSDRELARLEVLRDLTSGRLTASAAADLLGLERRQVQRLAKAYQDEGATALISKKRGQPSNRQTPASLKAQALAVIRERYADFGPTLAAEKLRELHGIYIGRETLRLWMLDAGLWADRQKRRGRVYARKPRGLSIPEANTIGKRPAEIGERTTFGHWECDLVAFRQVFGKHNITSLVERRSRYLFISRNPSRHSANIMAGLVRDLGPLPPACRRSITFDRGTEFAGFPSLKQSLCAQSYFCAPSAPWQKGTVENTNCRLRRLDLDVSTKTAEELAALARRMNATPRKCLGFRTQTEVFSEFVAQLASGA